MRKYLYLLCFLFACNLAVAQTIFYVKENATGDGSSWENASGDLQAMIKASVTSSPSEVWVAKGNYYPPYNEEVGCNIFIVLPYCNLFGGFKGSESSKNERERADLDANGYVDPWEFVNASVLDGNLDKTTDIWSKTYYSDGSWVWDVEMKGEKYSPHILYADRTSSVDGFVVSNGKSSSDNFVYNGQTIKSIITLGDANNLFVTNNISDSKSLIFDYDGKIRNTLIEDNLFESSISPMIEYLFVGNQEKMNLSIRCNSMINCSSNMIYCMVGKMSGVSIYNNSIKDYKGLGIVRIGNTNYSTSQSISDFEICNNIITSSEDIQGGILYAEGTFDDVSNILIANNTIHAKGFILGGVCYFGAKKRLVNFNQLTVVNNKVISEIDSVQATSIYLCAEEFTQAHNPYKFYVENNIFGNNTSISSKKYYDVYCSYLKGFSIYFYLSNNIVSDHFSNNSSASFIETDFQSIFERPTSFVGIAKTEDEKNELLNVDWRLKKGGKYNPNDYGYQFKNNETGIPKEQFLLIKYYVDSEGYLYLKDADRVSKLSLCDLSGKHISVLSIENNVIKLPRKGVYILRFDIDGEVVTKKIVW